MTGRAVISSLRNHGYAVRAIVSTGKNRVALESLGAEVVVGDLGEKEIIETALRDVTALYLMWPNFVEGEFETLSRVITLARNRVDRIIYHSVLRPHIEAMPHHWAKMRVEEKLYAQNVQYTILQPCAYLDNFFRQIPQILQDRVASFPWGENSAISYVDLRDVAEIATLVLTSVGHAGASYELCGPDALVADQVAKVMTQFFGFAVRANVPMLPSRLESYSAKCMASMCDYYEQHGFAGGSKVLEGLLGRSPNNLEKWLERFSQI